LKSLFLLVDIFSLGFKIFFMHLIVNNNTSLLIFIEYVRSFIYDAGF